MVFEIDEAVVERMGIVGPDRDAVYLQIGMEFAEGFATGRCDDEDGGFRSAVIDRHDEQGVAEDPFGHHHSGCQCRGWDLGDGWEIVYGAGTHGR